MNFLNELPDGFEYAGKLTEEEKQYAGIIGDKYYVPKDSDDIECLYVYQECVIGGKRKQWAYVKWTKK